MTLMMESALKQKHNVVVAGWKAGYFESGKTRAIYI